MKKLFYIILVIVILGVISYFVKQEAPQTEAVVTEEVSVDGDAIEVGAAEVVVPEDPENLGDGEIVESTTMTVEDVANENIPEVAPENDGAEEVEEANPSETSDEDETVVSE